MKALEKKPLAIDLFCGLGGWTEGLLAAGWDVVGYDIEKHEYGEKKYPAKLVLRDVLTIHGSEFKDAQLIVSSPPCQEYSYMAMPWKRGKQIADALRGHGWFPEGYKGSRNQVRLNRLFNACFRIQREAIEASGRFIPLVVENVRGAQAWVGPAWDHYGSFYLWGDVPELDFKQKTIKGFGGTWFHNAELGTTNPNRNRTTDPAKGRKIPGFRFDGSGGLFQTASVEGLKTSNLVNIRKGHSHTRHLTNQQEHDAIHTGTKQISSRKATSAEIAKIPFTLAKHVAEYWHPKNRKN